MKCFYTNEMDKGGGIKMWKNDLSYVTEKHTTNDVQKLITEYDKTQKQKLLDEIFNIMKKRVNVRYFSIMDQWRDSKNPNKEQFGFIMMSVNCVLIELYYQLYHGSNETTDIDGSIVKAYKWTIPLLDENLDSVIGERFYKDVRCKIIHQAQTEKNVALTFETDSIYVYSGNFELYNPDLVYVNLRKLYDKLFEQASRENNNNKMIRNNILSKMRNIAFKK